MARGDIASDRTAPMEDGIDSLHAEARARQMAAPGPGEDAAPEDAAPDYLLLLKDAEQRGVQYFVENLQGKVDTSYRAFRNQHFAGSKYLHQEYRNRSKLFRPKTRTAVRKAGAQAVSALFASSDAVKCSAGDEGNPMQRANAALIQQLFQYRTDRTSGQAALPWFRLCAGAHQDATITSVCVSKQSWKLELRKQDDQVSTDPETGEQVTADVYKKFIDRPDSTLIPIENICIDPSANWLSPIQSAAFFRVKYPMSIDEVREMQKHPLTPWKPVSENLLRGAAGTVGDQASRDVRQQRDGGTDRLDQRFTGSRSFEIVWAYENFIRWMGQDFHFWSLGTQAYLTDPRPVEEVYPEQGGERPYTFGVVNLEAHRLFPMSPVESWQQSQIEINDFANLVLDTAKLTVAPVTKVIKGMGVDLDKLMRRGPNAQILVSKPEDVTFEKAPGVDGAAMNIVSGLNVDFDDQAGQFNSGSVMTNRQLNETVGGMKLISGSANAVGEFDLRVWIETWVEPTVAQIVKLIQFYENDQTILALCGQKAQLFEKFGLSEINDQLLQQQVKVKIDAGIGNADPEQKLGRLANGIQVLTPLFENNPDVANGSIKINLKEIADEVFSLCGYRDGADRFITVGQPQQNPTAPLEAAKLQSEIEKNKKMGSAAMLTGIANVHKAALGEQQAEDARVMQEIDTHLRATETGHQHGLAIRQHHADAAHRNIEFAASRQDAAQQAAADQAAAEAPAAAQGAE